jgi:hypothetical protein
LREPRQPKKKRRLWSAIAGFLKTVPGMLAAIATSLSAIVAILAVIGAGASDRGGSSGTTHVPQSNTTSSPSISETTEPIPTTSSVPPSTTVTGVFREADGVPVAVGYCIDLDSQAPNWGVDSRSGRDLCISTFGEVKVSKLAIVKDPPSLEDCQAQTVLRNSLTRAQRVVGQKLCAQSSDDRWAYLRIAAIDVSAQTMSFDIVVWKLFSDP